MRSGRSWDVPNEFWRLWWGHRQLRKLIMQVDVEPAGKGPAGRRSAAEFQRPLLVRPARPRRRPPGRCAIPAHPARSGGAAKVSPGTCDVT